MSKAEKTAWWRGKRAGLDAHLKDNGKAFMQAGRWWRIRMTHAVVFLVGIQGDPSPSQPFHTHYQVERGRRHSANQVWAVEEIIEIIESIGIIGII